MKIRTKWAGVPAAVAAMAALAAVAPAGASAASCKGTSIIGEGSSFQKIAHQSPGGTVQGTTGSIAGDQGWINLFKSGYTKADGSHQNQYCAQTTSTFLSTGQTISYNSTGSGAGVSAFGAGRSGGYPAGARSGVGTQPAGTTNWFNDRFVAYDDAPNSAEQANMNAGDPSQGWNAGLLHNIPVAQGSIAMDFNVPDGCSWPASFNYKPDAATQTTRFKIPNASIEKIYSGVYTTWGQLFAGNMTGTPANFAGVTCNNVPITPVVRSDSSGTTFNFKQWLALVAATDGSTVDWGQSGSGLNTPANNTVWPNAYTSASGGGGVAGKAATTDGAVTYAFLGDSRAKGFDITPIASGSAPDTTFWIPVYNNATTPQLADPATNGTYGYKAGQAINTHGSNCAKAVYKNVPTTGLGGVGDPTTADSWNTVSGIGQTAGYPMCYLSWIGAWDSYSAVYGSSLAEQKMEMSVKDYLTAITGNGQGMLPLDDYQKLPTTAGSGGTPTLTMAQLAKNGVAAIHF